MNTLLLDTERAERLVERPAAERDARERKTASERASFVDVVSASGAILVVGLGLAFVFVIALVSLGTVPASQKAAVVTAAFTVLGTIVGAYFGVKVGSAGKERAESQRDAESVKVQELAARIDPETATAALASANRRLRGS